MGADMQFPSMKTILLSIFKLSPKCLFCVLTAVLGIGVSLMMVHVDHSWNVNFLDLEHWKEYWIRRGVERRGYVLALSYMDQVSWAATRLRSLQCWVSRLKFSHVVEPFVNDIYLGVPSTSQAVTAGSSLTFGDIFDVQSYNHIGGEHSFPPLASWEEFLITAPRKVVLAQIVYEGDARCPENAGVVKECNHTQLRTFFTELLAPHSFVVYSEVCINFNEQGFLKRSEFNHLVFSGVASNESISLVFDEWRAMYPFVVKRDRDIKCFLQFKDVACSPLNPQMADLAAHSLHPANEILITAQKYISLHLRATSGYVAVLVRWEKILLYDLYRPWVKRHYTGSECMNTIVEYLEEVRRGKGVFFSTDVGKYGSSTFHMYNATRTGLPEVVRYTEELIRYMYGESMTFEQYEQALVDVSGTTNPVFVSQVQRTIAAQAQCLLLVGSGLFHEHTLSFYKQLHNGSDCYKVIEVC